LREEHANAGQAAPGAPITFLNARLKAASDAMIGVRDRHVDRTG
jgi:hypothetical protein